MCPEPTFIPAATRHAGVVELPVPLVLDELELFFVVSAPLFQRNVLNTVEESAGFPSRDKMVIVRHCTLRRVSQDGEREVWFDQIDVLWPEGVHALVIGPQAWFCGPFPNFGLGPFLVCAAM